MFKLPDTKSDPEPGTDIRSQLSFEKICITFGLHILYGLIRQGLKGTGTGNGTRAKFNANAWVQVQFKLQCNIKVIYYGSQFRPGPLPVEVLSEYMNI